MPEKFGLPNKLNDSARNMKVYQYTHQSARSRQPKSNVLDFYIPGTGGEIDYYRVSYIPIYRRSYPLLRLDIPYQPKSIAINYDISTVRKHIENIRDMFNPSITDLANLLEISRQAIYKWLSGGATPNEGNFARLAELSTVADEFRKAGVSRAANTLLKAKAFEGESLWDLIRCGKNRSEHVQVLVEEARAMAESRRRFNLTKSKSKPTSDWQSYISIPGSTESSQ